MVMYDKYEVVYESATERFIVYEDIYMHPCPVRLQYLREGQSVVIACDDLPQLIQALQRVQLRRERRDYQPLLAGADYDEIPF